MRGWDLTEWEAYEVSRRRCPWSGGRLVRRKYFDGPHDTEGQVLACGICDCFGFDTGGGKE